MLRALALVVLCVRAAAATPLVMPFMCLEECRPNVLSVGSDEVAEVVAHSTSCTAASYFAYQVSPSGQSAQRHQYAALKNVTNPNASLASAAPWLQL